MQRKKMLLANDSFVGKYSKSIYTECVQKIGRFFESLTEITDFLLKESDNNMHEIINIEVGFILKVHISAIQDKYG